MVKFKYLNKPYVLAVLICLFVFYSGLFYIPDTAPLISLIKQSEITNIKGKIISSPAKTSNKKYYSCKFYVYEVHGKNKIKSSATGLVQLLIPAELQEAFYPGKLYSSAKNKIDYFLEAGGNYFLNGFFSNNVFIVKESFYLGFDENLFGKIDFFRAKLRLNFKKLMYTWQDSGGFLLALLSGSREYTDDCIRKNFKKSGLSHILALSGMHLSLFSGIALFIGKKSKRKKISLIIRVIFLILFVWFAGFSPSLLRAFICSMLLIISSISTKEAPDMLLILCFSFLLQCVISPSDIQNVGFILSYSALAGILIFNNYFRKILNSFISNYFSASISSSISAQIFTAPITLKLFGSFCPIGIIATCIVSPLVTIYIYSGLFLIIISLIFPGLAHASGIFMNLEYNIIRNITFIFSKAPYWNTEAF